MCSNFDLFLNVAAPDRLLLWFATLLELFFDFEIFLIVESTLILKRKT